MIAWSKLSPTLPVIFLGTIIGFMCVCSLGPRPKTNPSTDHFQYPVRFTESDIHAGWGLGTRLVRLLPSEHNGHILPVATYLRLYVSCRHEIKTSVKLRSSCYTYPRISKILPGIHMCSSRSTWDTGSSWYLHYIVIALAGNLQQHEVNRRKEELGILFLPNLEANAYFQQYRVNGRKDE